MWRQPKAFMRLAEQLERSQARWWHQPLGVLIVTLILLGQWYLAQFVPNKEPPPVEVIVWLAPLGAAVLVYGIPWLIKRSPSEVRLFDQCILRSRGNSQLSLKYMDIHCFAWDLGPEFNMLMLKHGREEKMVCLGVPLEIDTEHVSRILTEHGIRHELDGVKG